jgi:hypothetical protein
VILATDNEDLVSITFSFSFDNAFARRYSPRRVCSPKPKKTGTEFLLPVSPLAP